ncbi:hypothetical protein RN001_014451 [Aquatica leii]|uniref:Uncharacterized protein n=1 Tax=Aquatica leii TaxID=1421715 RepID=A0AAN7PPD9_9COLE|nr:hypothetical protein RN001_014451 [Aquatica leii]
MYIVSTKFIHKKEHKITWNIPGKNKCNEIDHILIKRKGESMIDNVRSYRGTSVETDHNVLITKTKLKIAKEKLRQQVKKKWDIEKLKKDEKKQTCENEINNLLQKENKKESIEEEWNIIKTIIIKLAKKIIGTKRVKNRNGWFDEECEKIIMRKREARIKWIERFKARLGFYSNAFRTYN